MMGNGNLWPWRLFPNWKQLLKYLSYRRNGYYSCLLILMISYFMKFAAAVPQDIRHGHFKARDEPDKTCYKLITGLGFLSMSKDPENLAKSSPRTQLS